MAALCAGVLALACVQEPIPVGSENAGSEEELISFTAVLEDSGTRTALLGDLSVVWSDQDAIKVFNASNPTGKVFTLSAGAGTGAGTFSGSISGSGPFYAVYPASAGGSLAGSSLRVTVPATQTYAEGSFGPGANLAVAKGTALETLRFRNVGGTLALKFTGSKTLTSVRLFAPVGQTLNGTAVVSGLDSDTPALTFDAGQTGEANAQLTLSCSPGVALGSTAKTFYIVAPVGTLAGGFFIEAVDSEGKAMVRHSPAGETPAIARSEVRPMPALAYTAKYKDAFLSTPNCGAFSKARATDSGAATALCSYVEGQGQYAWMNTPGTPGSRYVRLEDWASGFSLAFTMPYALTPGSNSTVSISALGSAGVTSKNNASMRVVKQFGERVWLCDPQNGNGYVVMMVNEED